MPSVRSCRIAALAGLVHFAAATPVVAQCAGQDLVRQPTWAFALVEGLSREASEGQSNNEISISYDVVVSGGGLAEIARKNRRLVSRFNLASAPTSLPDLPSGRVWIVYAGNYERTDRAPFVQGLLSEHEAEHGTASTEGLPPALAMPLEKRVSDAFRAWVAAFDDLAALQHSVLSEHVRGLRMAKDLRVTDRPLDAIAVWMASTSDTAAQRWSVLRGSRSSPASVLAGARALLAEREGELRAQGLAPADVAHRLAVYLDRDPDQLSIARGHPQRGADESLPDASTLLDQALAADPDHAPSLHLRLEMWLRPHHDSRQRTPEESETERLATIELARHLLRVAPGDLLARRALFAALAQEPGGGRPGDMPLADLTTDFLDLTAGNFVGADMHDLDVGLVDARGADLRGVDLSWSPPPSPNASPRYHIDPKAKMARRPLFRPSGQTPPAGAGGVRMQDLELATRRLGNSGTLVTGDDQWWNNHLHARFDLTDADLRGAKFTGRAFEPRWIRTRLTGIDLRGSVIGPFDVEPEDGDDNGGMIIFQFGEDRYVPPKADRSAERRERLPDRPERAGNVRSPSRSPDPSAVRIDDQNKDSLRLGWATPTPGTGAAETSVSRASRSRWSPSIRDVVFDRADLNEAKFDSVTLQNAVFSASNLTATRFEEVKLRGVDFSRADLSRTVFVKTTYDCATRFPKGFRPDRVGLIAASDRCHGRPTARDYSGAVACQWPSKQPVFPGTRFDGMNCGNEQQDLPQRLAGASLRHAVLRPDHQGISFDDADLSGAVGPSARHEPGQCDGGRQSIVDVLFAASSLKQTRLDGVELQLFDAAIIGLNEPDDDAKSLLQVEKLFAADLRGAVLKCDPLSESALSSSFVKTAAETRMPRFLAGLSKAKGVVIDASCRPFLAK